MPFTATKDVLLHLEALELFKNIYTTQNKIQLRFAQLNSE